MADNTHANIFRKKALDRISSPENLTDYLRVANPGIWVVLAAVILLLAGVIIHDLSKISEMKSDEYGNVTDYTREGLLVGHLVRGVARLAEAAKNVGVTGEIVVLLEHMIISHHGIPEYGSPRPPMFPEAEVLNWIDTLDARMNEMEGIMARVPAGAFSEKIWSLDRRLYHPFYEEGAE